VLIFAGASPFTQEGELKGSRNEFIQWIQDVFDQRGLVRGYVKYDNELRTGRNIKQIGPTAPCSSAHSDPKGPVYLMGAREVHGRGSGTFSRSTRRLGSRFSPCALPPDGVAALAEDLGRAKTAARRHLVYGAQSRRVGELARLAQRLAMPVLDSGAELRQLPGGRFRSTRATSGTTRARTRHLAEADLVLVIDSDVPWIPTVSKPARRPRRIFTSTPIR